MENIAFDPHKLLSELFVKAKSVDEFEYCCTLLRVSGMESPGWDLLHESDQLTQQLLAMINAPIENRFRHRLYFFLYCHLTEMEDIYNIVGNMLRVIKGERYSMKPYIAELDSSKQEARVPSTKVVRIRKWSDEIGFGKLGEMFAFCLVKEVRNAFYHSDYILTEESFNIKQGQGVRVDNTITNKIPHNWLMPRVELGINAALAVIGLTFAHIRSYKQDKVVKGRFTSDGSYEDIQLTVREGFGLSGFKAPPDKRFQNADKNIEQNRDLISKS